MIYYNFKKQIIILFFVFIFKIMNFILAKHNKNIN